MAQVRMIFEFNNDVMDLPRSEFLVEAHRDGVYVHNETRTFGLGNGKVYLAVHTDEAIATVWKLKHPERIKTDAELAKLKREREAASDDLSYKYELLKKRSPNDLMNKIYGSPNII